MDIQLHSIVTAWFNFIMDILEIAEPVHIHNAPVQFVNIQNISRFDAQ